MDFGDVTDGRLVSPSIASATLSAAYAGEGKEQEQEGGREEALMPITIKVNKVNGEAAVGRGDDTANGDGGGPDKAQPAQPEAAGAAAAVATTRPGEAVAVDDAGLERVSKVEVEDRETDEGQLQIGLACCFFFQDCCWLFAVCWVG